MAVKTKIKTKKLVYETSKVSVKQNDTITLPNIGVCLVDNIHAPRKKAGFGSVTLKLPNGKLQEYAPSIIHAIWQ